MSSTASWTSSSPETVMGSVVMISRTLVLSAFSLASTLSKSEPLRKERMSRSVTIPTRSFPCATGELADLVCVHKILSLPDGLHWCHGQWVLGHDIRDFHPIISAKGCGD